MFRIVGQAVSRAWPLMLIGWALLFLAVWQFAPDFSDVTEDGEFVFLPEDSPSRVAEDLYRRAFPSSVEETEDSDTTVQQNPLGSTVVIVIRRVDQRGGLTEADKEWVENELVPELEKIAQSTGRGYETPDKEILTPSEGAEESLVKVIWSLGDRKIGPLLTSPDNHATLVALELKTEFLDRSNALFIRQVEELVSDVTDRTEKPAEAPVGIDIAISGSATVGRDMLANEEASASNTERYTVILVIILLLAIYRAPLLALIPLVTVGLAVEVTIHVLRILAGWGVIGLFNGIEVYVTVVTYGAGVDYCLFLIARYKEELDGGRRISDAIALAIQQVGIALATSAGTSICGIGMMGFAEFRKFQQAGVGISIGLFVVLIAALTFTPALLVMCGRWAFWPDTRQETIKPDADLTPRFSLFSLLQEQQWLERAWEGVANVISAKPGRIFLAAVAVMVPFAVIALKYHTYLSYGLLTDLPQDDPSVQGAKAVQRHFAAGIAGPTTILLHHPELNVPEGVAGAPEGEQFAGALTEELISRMDELKLVDLRSQHDPLGITEIARDYQQSLQRRRLNAVALRNMARKTYVSQDGDLAGAVVRLDLIFNVDPFDRDSIAHLDRIEAAIREALPAAYAALFEYRNSDVDATDDVPSSAAVEDAQRFAEETTIASIGSTASIRDLKAVTDSDQVRIYVLVVVSVYLVLISLLRKPAICGYLIVSVVFSYLVTLGFTFTVFYLLDPTGFAGLDWKVPIFLFTILIAMGEDYNILLMARVDEEQRTHGSVRGVLVALARTGSIISSCGIIMAGTFSSLATGTLMGMTQLGFALASGVLLDTFVVRPILVPAYLVMLHSGRFGKLGKSLGARVEEGPPADEA